MEYIFNIGLNRAGTNSLCEALNILQIPTIHYKINNIELETIIKKNISNNENLFFGLDSKYRAFSHFNGEKYYELLYHQYPNSKFIFTDRDKEDYIKSESWRHNEYKTDFLLYFDTEEKAIDILNKKYNKKYEILKFFEDKSENFLKINICDGDGWEKLCPFLNFRTLNIPFPFLNMNAHISEAARQGRK